MARPRKEATEGTPAPCDTYMYDKDGAYLFLEGEIIPAGLSDRPVEEAGE